MRAARMIAILVFTANLRAGDDGMLAVQTPIRFLQPHVWNLGQLLRPDRQGALACVTIFHKHLISGDVKMLMEQNDPKTLRRVVLYEDFSKLIKSYIVRRRAWRHFVNVRQVRYGVHRKGH